VEKIKILKFNELVKLENNPRTIKDKDFKILCNSIKKFWVIEWRPFLISNRTWKNVILWWNQRYEACKKLWIDKIPVYIFENLTKEEEEEIIIRDNISNWEWDFEQLSTEWNCKELEEWGLDIPWFDNIDDIEDIEDKTIEDDNFEVNELIKTDIVLWDLFEIWEHKLLCWNSTKKEDIKKLMNWEKAVLWLNDPPYWMKLEAKWIEWDNMNYNDLLNFNIKWIDLQFDFLEDNWSFYCWGTDEPLMDIYSEIMKPYIKKQKATFRNLITWDKWNWQGQNSENTRSYAIADEKCLFMMCGVQGFNNNADNYFEGWEPIRDYLEYQIKWLWESDWKIAKALWYKDGRSVNHWRNKSQFNFPTKENYQALKEYAKSKEYDLFKKEYDLFKKEYDELKKEYYSTRAYFNNTHDNFNNVWHFDRTSNSEKEDTEWHYTPKPLKLCERIIKSSCPEKGLIIDFFLWSGSTMVASHQLNRKCYWIEIQPKYVQTIINRMQKLAPELEIKKNWQTYINNNLEL